MKAKTALEAYDMMVRLIGEAETNRRLGTKGRKVVAEARVKTAGKALKEARGTAKITAMVRETLTAAQAPRPAPGPGGAAPAARDGDDGLFAAMAAQTGRGSPFWQTPVATGAGAAPEPSKPLHQMDADEFRAHAQAGFTANAAARGFASPAWS